MNTWSQREHKHCRWCGIGYYAAQPHNKDGFCKPAHKMAHARAYKNYVTRKPRQISDSKDQRVTLKKPRKRGKESGKKSRK